MRLAELSTAEQDYLSRPLPPVDTWTPLLTARLCGVLGARMKQRVQIVTVTSDPLNNREHAEPEISWDSALDALWVRARLGGSARILPPCAALSRNLLHTLQQALAETWVSSAEHPSLPRALHLRIECTSKTGEVAQAALTIYFPASLSQMDRWVQRLIAT